MLIVYNLHFYLRIEIKDKNKDKNKKNKSVKERRKIHPFIITRSVHAALNY